MFGIEAISSYILVVALLTLLVAALVWQAAQDAAVGDLVVRGRGRRSSFGDRRVVRAVQLTGYRLFKPPPQAEAASSDPSCRYNPDPVVWGAGKGAPGQGRRCAGTGG